MANTKGGLGKGINALFNDSTENVSVELGEGIVPLDVDITLIDRNPNQPRKLFNEDSLNELATSIAAYGVLQPLLVIKKDDGRYMIIAGERRYRACLKAGLRTVPVVQRPYTPEQIQEISLIENLHREDLNAIEAAEGMKELMESHGLTQEEVAVKIGKSRPYVTNTLRLLQLPQEVSDLVRTGKLSPGHARTLISMDNKEELIALANKACEHGISVRELEREVNLYYSRKNIPHGPRKRPSLEMRELVNDMKRIFKTKVMIKGNETMGRITIDYYTADDLDRVHEYIQHLKKLTD